MAVSRGLVRLMPCYLTFGAQHACLTRLFSSDRSVVCAKALPKSALGMNKSWYRMLILDKSDFKSVDVGSTSLKRH
jgi:hypothetical protein